MLQSHIAQVTTVDQVRRLFIQALGYDIWDAIQNRPRHRMVVFRRRDVDLECLWVSHLASPPNRPYSWAAHEDVSHQVDRRLVDLRRIRLWPTWECDFQDDPA